MRHARTVPKERNGYFDSKLLSRQHAEVQEEGAKVSHLEVLTGSGCLRLSIDIHERRQELQRHFHHLQATESRWTRENRMNSNRTISS